MTQKLSLFLQKRTNKIILENNRVSSEKDKHFGSIKPFEYRCKAMPIINEIQVPEIIPERQGQMNWEIILENNIVNVSAQADQKNNVIEKIELNNSQIPDYQENSKIDMHNDSDMPFEMKDKNNKWQENPEQKEPIKDMSYESPQKSVSFAKLN